MRITKANHKSVKTIKAGRRINGLKNTVIYEDEGIKVTLTGRDYDMIAVIENDTDKDYCVNTYYPDKEFDDPNDCNVVVPAHDWLGVLANDEGYDIVDYFKSLGGVTACDKVKASKRVSSKDQAVKYIKAAIDILGKSSNKDEVTKDSIANLATVMFDIEASKK